ncbi:MAG: VIT1/CCC1 transporter family protein [Bryobacterales bacterium]|nr:VIT1/CCC1 transporter family protein [Bryobacterales bacterium]MBV9398615.1 VIT1/CCC1 transporter family protein [Bryobacterales bacterium]
MPTTPHIEHHFESSDTVRDVVIGMADGLTVPFALAAGLTGAVDATRIIVIAGLAEIAAGSIAMGLGGYLAARGDAEHYASERKREELEIVEKTDIERHEVLEILESYGLTHEESVPILAAFERKPKVWVDWMMRFELGLEEPDPKRAVISAVTIAASYVAGGLIPLAPYMFASHTMTALRFSVAATLVALAIFGYVKGRFTGAPPVRSAVRTTVIGGLAAGAAFSIARLFS